MIEVVLGIYRVYALPAWSLEFWGCRFPGSMALRLGYGAVFHTFGAENLLPIPRICSRIIYTRIYIYM